MIQFLTMLAVTAIAFIAAFFIVLAVFVLWLIFSPGFDEYGFITECIGCQGCTEAEQKGCRYNPAYWSKTKYIGPSRRELRRLRKEAKRGR